LDVLGGVYINRDRYIKPGLNIHEDGIYMDDIWTRTEIYETRTEDISDQD
jgi:hypothetical protein